MKTEVVTPQDVFYNPTRLVVPLFQRPYVWSKEEQWQPLWNDITRLIEVIQEHDQGATHFLGAIVVQQVPSALGGLPMWNVIDGQQRLTTLLLFLDALHSQLEERAWPQLAGQIHALVENPTDFVELDHERFKLWPTNRDRAGFTSVMSAGIPVNYSSVVKSRMSDAHQFFAESISAWLTESDASEKKARTLVSVVKDRLELASIRLDASEDAQEIFETLNARGTPLSAADLIKNYVFQRLGGTDERAEAMYDSYWAEFETPFWEEKISTGRVKHTRSSLFLYQWLTARMLEDFPVREVFTQFKYYVTTKSPDVGHLLPRIKAAADRYREIIEGAQTKSGELTRPQLFAYRMGTLDSEIARPILIWLDEPEQDGVAIHDKNQVISTLESWFVRRALVRAQSQGSNRFMADLLQHLDRQPKGELPQAAESFLAANHTALGFWPGDAEVASVLTDIDAYWRYLKGRLRMVLEALEDSQRGYPNGKKLTMGPVTRYSGTIEHLMPQSWRKHWPADLTDEQDALRAHLIQTLGNLTLVTQSLNAKVSNGPWSQKRDHFANHDDLLITRKALRIGELGWNEDAIRARTSLMIEQILEIWPAPKDHVGLGGPPVVDRAPATSVDLAQLVAVGLIEPGTMLASMSPTHAHAAAVIAQDGRVFVGDIGYDTPTAAAKMFTQHEVNGWAFWTTVDRPRTLAEIRSTYLESLGVVDAAAEDAPLA